MGKKKKATGKQKRISHPRTKGKREREEEEEVESRGVCCKKEGRELEEKIAYMWLQKCSHNINSCHNIHKLQLTKC